MFYIRHYIKSKEDFKILLTCPICLKDLFADIMIKLPDQRRLIEDTKLTLFEKVSDKKEYEHICPHCNLFSITYINQMKREEKKCNLEITEGVKKLNEKL